jgi:hypothetical protein
VRAVHELLERLRDGDPEDAAAEALADPPLVAVLLEGMVERDEIVSARAATAAELAARERPELFAAHAGALIAIAAAARHEDVRRRAAQMLARVELSPERAGHASRILEGYLADASEEVRAWALSAIVALANDHPGLRPRARELVEERLEDDGPPAISERAALLKSQADSWPSGAGSS